MEKGEWILVWSCEPKDRIEIPISEYFANLYGCPLEAFKRFASFQDLGDTLYWETPKIRVAIACDGDDIYEYRSYIDLLAAADQDLAIAKDRFKAQTERFMKEPIADPLHLIQAAKNLHAASLKFKSLQAKRNKNSGCAKS